MSEWEANSCISFRSNSTLRSAFVLVIILLVLYEQLYHYTIVAKEENATRVQNGLMRTAGGGRTYSLALGPVPRRTKSALVHKFSSKEGAPGVLVPRLLLKPPMDAP